MKIFITNLFQVCRLGWWEVFQFGITVHNKIREPNDWKPICSFYIKSNNISDLALFQGLI